MTRRIIALNVVLVALLGLLGWRLWARWVAEKAKEQALVAQPLQSKPVLAPPIPPPAKPISPAEYIEVAQNTLFSQDRNPNVVVEPPKPAPEPPMPALPQYHGQLDFGEPVALLSIGNAAQKSYRVGEKIGEFTLAAFDKENITLEWRGKTVEKKLAELAPKEAPPAAAASPSAAGAPGASGTATPRPGASAGAQAAAGAPPVTSAASSPVVALSGGNAAGQPGQAQTAKNDGSPALGPEMPGGMRECVDGDNSPSGTVLSGFKKNVITMMFGKICRWEPVQ